VTLPRWRRRTRARPDQVSGPTPELNPNDAARLEHELSQFRG
jgi:hypothetical protein